jgi:hypothetical protein
MSLYTVHTKDSEIPPYTVHTKDSEISLYTIHIPVW